MQMPKSKARTLEVPKKKSPAATPKAAHQLKPGPDGDSLSSPNQASRTPKDGSPKVGQRRSPQSPISEKKRPSKVSDLSTQITQLQEDLKKARDQLNASESSKRQAQQEHEDAKRQVLAMSAKFEESQQQLQEISASDDDRILELRKLSHERDRAWQSELEAVQKQHEFDSSALASAMNEIQKLKAQLAKVSSESDTNAEIESMRIELDETRTLVENLKAEIFDRKESEARARETLSKTEMQLDIVNTTAELLRSENTKAKETLNAMSYELEQSKSRVQSLGELVNKLEEELDQTKCQASQLKSALEAAEVRYQEEYIQSTMQIRNAYEQCELAKSEWSKKESRLVAELNAANAKIEDLRAISIDKETELQNKSNLADLKERLMDKEMHLQEISQENEKLKIEIKKMEAGQSEGGQEAISLQELARTSEKEVLLKLAHLNAESERNSKRAALVSEQLDAAQAANTEMEAEMRKLKVQSDQWRKAAEAAAAMLSSNGKIGERTGSLDSAYIAMESPFSEDKKNGNVLKKIGGLWKKGHP